MYTSGSQWRKHSVIKYDADNLNNLPLRRHNSLCWYINRRGKGTRDAIGAMRIIAEGTLEIRR